MKLNLATLQRHSGAPTLMRALYYNWLCKLIFPESAIIMQRSNLGILKGFFSIIFVLFSVFEVYLMLYRVTSLKIDFHGNITNESFTFFPFFWGGGVYIDELVICSHVHAWQDLTEQNLAV